MRIYVAGVLLAFATTTAIAGKKPAPTPRLVRAALAANQYNGSPIVTGSTIPLRYAPTLLFLKEPCRLRIAGARYMHRAWMNLGAYQVGCWYPTQGGNYVVIDGAGNIYPSSDYVQQEPRAILNPDETVTIIQPDFDARTFAGKVSLRMALQALKHRNEKP